MSGIALVLDRFDPQGGGLEQWSFKLARWLSAVGHKVHVVAFDFGEHSSHTGISHHPLPKSSNRLERAALVESYLRKLSPDLIHDLGVGWYYDVLQPQAGSKVVNYRRSLLSLTAPAGYFKWFRPSALLDLREFQRLERRQYTAGSGIIVTVSRMVRDDLRALYGVKPDRLRQIYNGVDTERFSPERGKVARELTRRELCREDEILFLMAARNFRLKGLSTALKALGLLKRSDVPACLAIIGGQPPNDIRRLACRLGVEDRVKFCGFVPDPVPYYLAADAYVHPTFYDACSLAVLEAWASGLPVITTPFNGAAEMMVSGKEGFIHQDPRDVRGLAGKMAAFMDAELRSSLSTAARKLALAHTLENNFRAIEKIYLEATGLRRHRLSKGWG